MDKTDNIERLQDRKKRFLILFLFALLLGLIFTLATMYQKDRVMRVNNLEQARLIAGEIDQDNIKALKASDADLNTPNYERLKNNLSIIKNTTIKCRFLYLMGRRSDGKLFMYLDSEKKGSHDESPPGQLYEEASAGDIEAFETKKEISVGPVTDRWGAYISSLIPLVDRKTGEVTAVFGMDMDLEGWQKEILGAGVIPSIFSLLLMALVLAGYFLYSKKVNYGFGYKGLLQHVEIALACGAGIIITLAAAWTADKRQDQGFLESFSQLADNKIEMLSEKLNSFKKVELEGLAHYIERTKELSQKEFAGYTAYLTQDNRIQALEWVPVVSAKERAKYEKNAQLSGFSGYSFWEKDVDGKKIPAGPRELYYAVYNLNPIKGNEKSLGYDLGSETVRREALEEAVKSGLPAATDAVVLVQEKAAQKGLLIFRPVFTGENKKKIRGFALLVLRLEDFLKRTTGPVLNRNNSTVDIKLYQAFEDRPLPELTASSPAMILKGSEKEKTFYKREEFSVTRPLFIFDKVFILQLTPGSAFYSSYPKYSTGLTVLIGLILTGLMAFLFKLTINRKSELEQLVNERTNMLRQTEMRVAATLRSIGDGVISTDTKGCVVSLNNAAEKLTGWVWLEAHGRPIHEVFKIYDSATRKTAENPVDMAVTKGIMTELAENTVLVSKFGKEFQIADSCAPIKDYNGVVIGAVLVFRDISFEYEQKKEIELSQELLRKERAVLRGLLDSIPEIVFYKDKEGLYRGFNPEFMKFTGKKESEIIGKTDYDLFPPALAEYFREQDKVIMKDNKSLHNEIWITYPDGKKVLVDMIKSLLKVGSGEVIGLLGISRDITERSKLEEKIKTSEKNYSSLFEAIEDIILISTLEGKILYANRMASSKLGYSLEELKKKNVLELHLKQDRSKAENIFGDMLAQKRSACPLPLQDIKGKVIPVETRAWIGEWNGEKSLFCLSKDLSAEQESLQKFNKMFENNPALMTVSNYPEMKFLEVNEAFIKGTGYTREEVLGKTTGSLEMMAVGGKFTDIAEELQRKKRVQNIEVVLKTKNGELRNGIFSAEMVETQGKTYVLTVMIDITERKKAEMEVSKAVETKSEFVSMVSHELRTPLAVITESVKIVFDGSCGDLNTEQKDYLEVAVRNIDRLGRLINDVLFVQKLEAGMLKFNLVEKDINLLIQTTLEPVKSLAEKKGLAFEIQSGKNIPPIKMDSDKMEQVLLNLMSNALKFTDKGKITVVTEKEENYVKVSFIDTGIGIKKEDLNKLFGKFEQIYTGSERKSGGTGLGLAISKEIIISHKGKIWAESEWGKGTKFSFTLPLK